MINPKTFQWELGQMLVSAQGQDAVVHQRIYDVDANEYFYRIQFAPYNGPAQIYLRHMAYAVFYKREK